MSEWKRCREKEEVEEEEADGGEMSLLMFQLTGRERERGWDADVEGDSNRWFMCDCIWMSRCAASSSCSSESSSGSFSRDMPSSPLSLSSILSSSSSSFSSDACWTGTWTREKGLRIPVEEVRSLSCLNRLASASKSNTSNRSETELSMDVLFVVWDELGCAGWWHVSVFGKSNVFARKSKKSKKSSEFKG